MTRDLLIQVQHPKVQQWGGYQWLLLLLILLPHNRWDLVLELRDLAILFHQVTLESNTDNYFFWMALETGVIGMCINVIFFAFVFLSAYSVGKKYQGRLFSKEFFLMVFIFFFHL